ncbi:hypothetical protein MMC14_002985 [Varicellaria rhodocarpa]|nr:hypothetical protein [Varicellaria rhodocarpa]
MDDSLRQASQSTKLDEFRPPFRYTPLDATNNEIGLIQVLPAIDESLPTQCSLAHASLDSLTTYHTLSYAWIEDTSTSLNKIPEKGKVTIAVNKAFLSIGRNLAAALEARRMTSDREIPLWVDAMCINQQDLEERNRQVLRMRSIYKKAARVDVWLGPEADGSRSAFDFIHTICKSAVDLDWVKWSISSRRYSAEWKALYHLFQRSWWKRGWVIQEMATSKDVLVYCGTSSMKSKDLAACIQPLVTHHASYGPLLLETEGFSLNSDAVTLARLNFRNELWSMTGLLQT